MTVSLSPQRDCARRPSLAVAPAWPTEMRRRAGQRQRSREPQIKGSSAGGREFFFFFSQAPGKPRPGFQGINTSVRDFRNYPHCHIYFKRNEIPFAEPCCATQLAWLPNASVNLWCRGTAARMSDWQRSVFHALIPVTKAPAGSGSSRCSRCTQQISSRLTLFTDTDCKEAGSLIPVRTSSRAFSCPANPPLACSCCPCWLMPNLCSGNN